MVGAEASPYRLVAPYFGELTFRAERFFGRARERQKASGRRKRAVLWPASGGVQVTIPLSHLVVPLAVIVLCLVVTS
jgi:hypothetical protein